MVKIVLTVVVSLLFLDQVVGIGKQCYECEISSEEKFDNSCGKFDDSTDKCSVGLGGYCIKATSKNEDGVAQDIEFGCDGINFCTENGCRNATIDEEPTEVCCCDGNLCNSGTFESPKVTGKQCYDCMRSTDGFDDCGNFSSSTPKCNVVNETISCITSVATV